MSAESNALTSVTWTQSLDLVVLPSHAGSTTQPLTSAKCSPMAGAWGMTTTLELKGNARDDAQIVRLLLVVTCIV